MTNLITNNKFFLLPSLMLQTLQLLISSHLSSLQRVHALCPFLGKNGWKYKFLRFYFCPSEISFRCTDGMYHKWDVTDLEFYDWRCKNLATTGLNLFLPNWWDLSRLCLIWLCISWFYNIDAGLHKRGTLLYEIISNPKEKNFVSKIQCYFPQK